MQYNSLEIILERNTFYQKNYHKLLLTVFLFLLSLTLLIGFAIWQSNTTAVPKYFPTTPDGKIIDTPPMTVNHLLLENYAFNSKGELIEWPEVQKSQLDLSAEDANEHAILVFWVKRAVIEMFNFDFVNYRSVMQNLRNYFTAQGYERFLEALRSSKNLEAVRVGKRVAFANIEGQPKVVDSYFILGHKAWTVELPLEVTYESPSEEPLKQKLYAMVQVARVSTLQSRFYGLAIYQINFKAR